MSVSRDQMQQVVDEYLHTSLAFSNLLDRVEELERHLREHGWMAEQESNPRVCACCGAPVSQDSLYCHLCVQRAMVGTD